MPKPYYTPTRPFAPSLVILQLLNPRRHIAALLGRRGRDLRGGGSRGGGRRGSLSRRGRKGGAGVGGARGLLGLLFLFGASGLLGEGQ